MRDRGEPQLFEWRLAGSSVCIGSRIDPVGTQCGDHHDDNNDDDDNDTDLAGTSAEGGVFA